MDEYAYKLDLTSPLREPLIRAAIQALQLPVGSRGLDAGCGIGFQARLLAEAVGASGHVTGLDLSADMLAHAQEYTAQAGFADRVSFKEGNVHELPFEDNSFDWAWSMDCVGYLPQDQVPMLQELARVVKPGGRAAILAWSSEQLLPGHPTLEARLKATTMGIAPFNRGMKPALHFLRALGWFRTVGFAEPTSWTFAGDAYAPLSDELRNGVEAILQMRWPGAEAELGPEDWAEYQRLCQPESAGYILNRPDYYAFFTYSMFSGLVGE
jgi:demethylmenaquinone methyltransferase/2-methoxy-6-polyprenyl-1,4-benzoquinol methylase